jgi:hypothetical protein
MPLLLTIIDLLAYIRYIISCNMSVRGIKGRRGFVIGGKEVCNR